MSYLECSQFIRKSEFQLFDVCCLPKFVRFKKLLLAYLQALEFPLFIASTPKLLKMGKLKLSFAL